MIFLGDHSCVGGRRAPSTLLPGDATQCFITGKSLDLRLGLGVCVGVGIGVCVAVGVGAGLCADVCVYICVCG